MKPFTKPYHQQLFRSFIVGENISEAARSAGCSIPTARKFRNEYADDIAKAQAEAAVGVLDTLRNLIPRAVKRLEFWCDRPDLVEYEALKEKAVREGQPVPPPPVPLRAHSEDMRTATVIQSMFETMRDVDMEQRLRDLEARLAQLTAPPDEGGKPEGK